MSKIIESIDYFPAGYCTSYTGLLFKKVKNKKMTFPAGVFLIKHRDKGYLLYDTGYHYDIKTKLRYGLYRLGTPVQMTEKDQISSFVPSPLIGENIDELGARFPDMSEIYDISLRKVIKKTAAELDIDLKEGTYLQFTGPAYETPAEIRMARVLGADAVGMSTACEAVAANHMGMMICGISCISNLASGMSVAPLSHKEVQETADRVSGDFKKLVTESIKNIHEKILVK